MNFDVRQKLIDNLGGRVQFDVLLAPLLAYRVGGKSDALVFPKSLEDLNLIRTISQDFNISVTILGLGTNLIVKDSGIRGITVVLKDSFQSILSLPNHQVQVGGGVQKPVLLDWAIQNGLSGLEFSAGVPGTIGGGIFMNAGTKYGCYADILESLTLYSFQSGVQILRREEIDFGYRHQSVVTKDTLVLETVFQLKPGDTKEIQKEVSRIIEERKEKQPLDFPSCGSTFKNPPGLSAGRLIESAGLKGYSVGGAQVSTKHANFILNHNGASAQDILTIIKHIEETVKKHSGVQLEREVIVLGCEGEV